MGKYIYRGEVIEYMGFSLSDKLAFRFKHPIEDELQGGVFYLSKDVVCNLNRHYEHTKGIREAYGEHFDRLEMFIDHEGFCPMTANEFYMDLYKSINKHPWYPFEGAVACDTYEKATFFRPRALSYLGSRKT